MLQIGLQKWIQRLGSTISLFFRLLIRLKTIKINTNNLVEQIYIVGPGSLNITLLTACFISMVFTMQIAKEFLYLDAASAIGAVIIIAFTRELSPVLTAVIIAGKIGSSFTAEIATMETTEQIDALYLLNTNPIDYLVFPKVVACFIMLPILSTISLTSSIAISIFVAFVMYDVPSNVFLKSAFKALSLSDFLSCLEKSICFAIIIAFVSCQWGLTSTGGAKGVGNSTTSSVVTILLTIFITDFILSYFMFQTTGSSIAQANNI
uniref:Uncharacterized protein n=1 Tax=Pyropia haitanensis TaxID=1262161 RepID=M9PRV7_PYRHA|nr:hypothetical protein 263 [Neoporphyra haitanensis]AGG37172.1 hypothetical protein 263 [Neoporphyra haitanensis]